LLEINKMRKSKLNGKLKKGKTNWLQLLQS